MCFPSRKKDTKKSAKSSAEKEPPAAKKTASELVSTEAAEDKTRSEKVRIGKLMDLMGAGVPSKHLVHALVREQQKEKREMQTDEGPVPGDKKAGKAPEDDTIYEQKKRGKPRLRRYNSVNSVEDQLQMAGAKADDEGEEPTEQNWMWHTKDIDYMTHRMMLKIDAKTYERQNPKQEPQKLTSLDPYGPLDQLDHCPLFSRQRLMTNTLWSTLKTFPNEDTLMAALDDKTAEEGDGPRKGEQRLRWANPITKRILRPVHEEDTAEAPSDVDTGREAI